MNGHGPGAVRVAKRGARNNTLNREVFKAARRGADVGPYRDAALANGMPPGEVEATLASAARAGAEQAPNIVRPGPFTPMEVARELASTFFSDDGILTLRNYRGDFYRWSGQHWPMMAVLDIRSIAYQWLEDAHFEHPEKDELQRFNPACRKINDVIDALKAVVLLDSEDDAPCWTDETTGPPANEIVSMTNGLLHLPTRTLQLPHAGLLQPSLAAVPLSARVRPAGPVARVPA